MFCPFSNSRVPCVGVVSIGMKPVCMISRGVGTPPEFHRGVEPTCYLSYDLFTHTPLHGHGMPVFILGASQGGEIWTFPFHTEGCILLSLNLYI